MNQKFLAPVFALLTLAACERVDETEYCIKTNYGNVTDSALPAGITSTLTPGVEIECFSLTDQNYPEQRDDDDAGTLKLEVQTGGDEQPLTIQVEVSAVYAFDPATVYTVFMDKRSEARAEVEVFNSIQDGTRSAFSAWTVGDIFSNRRAYLSDSLKVHIQRKLGTRAIIKNIFVKKIQLPASIETARVASGAQDAVLDKARKQFVIDSTEALGTVLKAQADAQANGLRAQSYSTNPKLLDLEIAKEWAQGLSQVCKGVTTCIVGGQVMDLLPLRK